jgi:hypothetical protein
MAASTATVKTSSLLNQYTPQPDGSQVSGTFTCNGTSAVTVVSTAITANSSVVITLKTVGGTVGAIPSIKTITAGTGFTVSGTASDTSIYNYKII